MPFIVIIYLMKNCIKKSYPNKHQAKKFALYYKIKTGIQSKAYGCKLCGKVHLTTKV